MGEFQRPTFPLSPLAHKDSSDLVQCLLCHTIVSFDLFLNFIRLWSSASLLGHSWFSISGSLSLYGSSQVVELDTSSYLHQTLPSFGFTDLSVLFSVQVCFSSPSSFCLTIFSFCGIFFGLDWLVPFCSFNDSDFVYVSLGTWLKSEIGCKTTKSITSVPLMIFIAVRGCFFTAVTAVLISHVGESPLHSSQERYSIYSHSDRISTTIRRTVLKGAVFKVCTLYKRNPEEPLPWTLPLWPDSHW